MRNEKIKVYNQTEQGRNKETIENSRNYIYVLYTIFIFFLYLSEDLKVYILLQLQRCTLLCFTYYFGSVHLSY